MVDFKKTESIEPKASPAEIREFNIEALTYQISIENPKMSLAEARIKAADEVRGNEKDEEDFNKSPTPNSK